MTFEIGEYKVQIINESDHSPGSKDNNSNYEKDYTTESDYNLPTKFGIHILEKGIEINNAIIGAEGGASALHETSQLIENNRIMICCGDTIFCLDLPSLNLNWRTKADEATTLEIFKIENGYIIHGELEITRIDENGKIIWQKGGSDIFMTVDGNDDFEVKDNHIKATDWGRRVYKWNFDGTEIP